MSLLKEIDDIFHKYIEYAPTAKIRKKVDMKLFKLDIIALLNKQLDEYQKAHPQGVDHNYGNGSGGTHGW